MQENLSSEFITGLNEGTPEKFSDGDLRHAFELQRTRLAQEGLSLQENISLRGNFPEGHQVYTWKDGHYRTEGYCHTVLCERSISRQGKQIYKDKDQYMLYVDVTDCKDYTAAGKDPYICPSCGAVSELETLAVKGCPSCGTKFSVSELYPKVSNYYVIKDAGGTRKEVNGEIWKQIKPFLIIAAVLVVIQGVMMFGTEDFTDVLFSLPILIFMDAVAAAIIGYFVWAVRKVVKVFREAGKSVRKLPVLSSPEDFTREMAHYSDAFSYEYFSARVVSLLKCVIYSSHDSVLPFYTGPETTRFDHVIASAFTGGVGLESFVVKDMICTVQVYTFMENLCVENGKIRKKDEKIRMTMQKDLSGKTGGHFSIRALHCPSCGASYDALVNRQCPYCGHETDIKEKDWIVTEIA